MIKTEGLEGFEAKFIKATNEKRTLKDLVPEGYVALSEAELAFLWFTQEIEIYMEMNLESGYFLTTARPCFINKIDKFCSIRADHWNIVIPLSSILHGVFVKKLKVK